MHPCLDGYDGIALTRELGYSAPGWPFRYGKALLAAARGEQITVATPTAEMIDWSTPRGSRTVAWHCRHAVALAALGRGDFEDAYQQVSSISPADTGADRTRAGCGPG